MAVRRLEKVYRLRYFRFCNILHIWTIWAIPIYRVYRLYDTHVIVKAPVRLHYGKYCTSVSGALTGLLFPVQDVRALLCAIVNVKRSKEGVALLFSPPMPKSSSSSVVRAID